jgi:formylglycine-generating enzyme required for sulfatase activity
MGSQTLLVIVFLLGCTPKTQTHIQAEALAASGKSGQPVTFQLPNGLPLPVRWIGPDSYRIGSPESEEGRLKDELLHEVQITEGFFITETEISQQQWSTLLPNNPSKNAHPNCPVENVSWEEARTFCRILTEHHGRTGDLLDGWEWDLPTEAQWEIACRAGNPNPTFDRLELIGWYAKNSGNVPHPVGLKPANAWGLKDMHGNVAEWCVDWFSDYPTNQVLWIDPVGPIWSFAQVTRGGHFQSTANECRSAARAVGIPKQAKDPSVQKLLDEQLEAKGMEGLETAPNGKLGFRPVLKLKKRV